MDALVQLYFNKSELNGDVKILILNWITFFKNNWNFLFNVDKEIVLNLEFFLDNKKVINKNAPPNNHVYLHELKKNPEIVLKFMKLALHLLLCKLLDIDTLKEDESNEKVIEQKKCQEKGKEDECSGTICNSSSANSIDKKNNNIKNSKEENVLNNSKEMKETTHSNSNGRDNPFIRRDEISDFEKDNMLINELKCDRHKESEFFRNYFLTNRITIYIYNWNKINKFESLKSEKVNQLICLRGSVLRVSPIQLLITKLDFICEKCKGIIQIEFIDGKFETPKKCPNRNCDSRNFHPIRESAKSVEYQKIILKENKKILNSMNEMDESNAKNLTVTLEVSKFFVNSCIPGNYVEVLGILKVISYNNNYFINGKNSLYNMYVDCLSIFPLSSKKYLNNSSFNFEKMKETKNKLYNSFLWESYIDKISKRLILYFNDVKCGKINKCQKSKCSNDPAEEEKISLPDHAPFKAHLTTMTSKLKKLEPIGGFNTPPSIAENYDITREIYIKTKTNICSDASTVNNSIEMSTNEVLIDPNNRALLSDHMGSGSVSGPISGSGYNTNILAQFGDEAEKVSTSNNQGNDSIGSTFTRSDQHHRTYSILNELEFDGDELCMYGDYIHDENAETEKKRKKGKFNLNWCDSEKETNEIIQTNETNHTDEMIQGNNRNTDHHFNESKDFDSNVLEFIRDMQKYGKNKFYLLVASLCPRIIMSNYIKAGMLLSLLGGKTIYDEYKQIKRRGNIHNLLIGDPGLGKSRILQYVSNIIENSLFICSTSTSVNGLTACAFKDATNNEYSLEGGALVLSDKGICCIDELDKISLTDQQSFLECMESQCINISKAGIVCNLKTRCSIIAASNPKEGKYNYNKTIFENIKIPFPLLSRFDLIFLLTDKMSEEKDYQISNYLISSNYDEQRRKKKKKKRKRKEKKSKELHKKVVHNSTNHRRGLNTLPSDTSDTSTTSYTSNDDDDDSEGADTNMFSLKNDLLHKCKQIDEQSYLPVELLGVFIKYCRKCIFPTLSIEAKKYIRKFYLHLRNLSATHSNISAPITIRQLESLIRLCQARARGDLSNVVTLYHAKEVVEIYQKTIFYPLYLKTLNFREKSGSKVKKGKSVSSISNAFKESIIQFAKHRENKIFNKDLHNLAKSVILSADSYISDEALIHYVNNDGFILYKGEYWQVDPFYLR
ncbi:DNA replication licensing factor MCM8 [Plasmodium gonderi]|uniref:DNA helicase n=1 Tax=Plasmodium gonderi TaxID=77519 RepID=A0A1Y1JJZ8_PLAGO|nr:DNA replication licensing factor MCM8 [Plasmodium gonderi]GAW82846.1 DNA replication licensing factor MCM8 [Plasmodium gonderi]